MTARAAAYLTEGTFLPCVYFRDPEPTVDLAIRRQVLHHGQKPDHPVGDRSRREEPLRDTGGPQRSHLLRGGDSYELDLFLGNMRDGTEHSFSARFRVEFFDTPDGYSGDELVDVVPHRQNEGKRYRDLPFFECFLERLL